MFFVSSGHAVHGAAAWKPAPRLWDARSPAAPQASPQPAPSLWSGPHEVSESGQRGRGSAQCLNTTARIYGLKIEEEEFISAKQNSQINLRNFLKKLEYFWDWKIKKIVRKFLKISSWEKKKHFWKENSWKKSCKNQKRLIDWNSEMSNLENF